MMTEEILKNKSLKAKGIVEELSKALLEGKIKMDDVIKAAAFNS
jgi:hypothetical protein